MLLIAYPNHNETTDFEFSYWLDGYNQDEEDGSCTGDNCGTTDNGEDNILNIFDG